MLKCTSPHRVLFFTKVLYNKAFSHSIMIVMRHLPLPKAFALSLLCTALLSACTPQAEQPTPSDNTATPSTSLTHDTDAKIMDEEFATGPKAAATRTPAPTKVRHSADGQVATIAIDYGNASVGEYTAPVRGLIIAPVQSDTPTPLIILSHLRAPNCADLESRYPCADGVAELRYDEGMQYIGEHLAKLGFTVVIPDLAPAFIGLGVKEPYDQTLLWQHIISPFISTIEQTNGGDDKLGTAIAPVDLTNIGLFVHSRSAQMTDTAKRLFGNHLKSILAYAPSYETFELADISPAPMDIPYLAIVGSRDTDVGASANLWLSHYATTPRNTVASTVELPHFGHMSINRTAAKAGIDDRRGCDMIACQDDKAHEQMILDVISDWFGASLQGKHSTLPLTPHTPLPEQVANHSARWLALSPKAIGYVDAKALSETALDKSAGVQYCAYSDPMNPAAAIMPACPEPEMGVVQILTPVAYIDHSAKATTTIKGASALALHIAPTGSHADGKGTTVDIALLLDNGETVSLTIPATHPALMDRASEHDSGSYRLGTVHLPLPQSIADRTITAVTITTDRPVLVRSVDFW